MAIHPKNPANVKDPENLNGTTSPPLSIPQQPPGMYYKTKQKKKALGKEMRPKEKLKPQKYVDKIESKN